MRYSMKCSLWARHHEELLELEGFLRANAEHVAPRSGPRVSRLIPCARRQWPRAAHIGPAGALALASAGLRYFANAARPPSG